MRLPIVCAFAVLSFALPSCGSSSSTEPPNAPIDAGAADSADAAPEAAQNEGSAGAAGSSGNPDCQFTVQNPDCNNCLHTTCAATCASCSLMADCGTLYTCMRACSSHDCQKQCEAKYPTAVVALMDFLGRDGCVDTQCKGSCNLGWQ